jgi:hypothetical protein
MKAEGVELQMSSGLGIALNLFIIYTICWLIGYFIWASRSER